MKLVILCGSLEPGKDGVGDYSRRLAEYCRANHHEVWLCSLNDAWITSNQVEDNLWERRIASVHPWPERIQILEKLLTNVKPDLVSLQFVPYAYHKKGFCYELTRHLTIFAKEYSWQIMFHELWLGLNPTDSWKYKILGRIQRHYALQLIKELAPKVIHTQAGAYSEVLRQVRRTSIRLPLFSNIEVEAKPSFAEFYGLLNQHNSLLTPDNRSQTIVLVFFGSLHPEWDPDQLMQKLHGKKLLFLSLGRLGNTGTQVWRNFAEKYSDRAEFIILGELIPKQISAALQFADVGVAASPWNLIEKSGSVAAMVEHGLPVIVTRNDFLTSEHYPLSPAWSGRLHAIWLDSFDISLLTKKAPASGLPPIGNQFLADLQTALPAS